MYVIATVFCSNFHFQFLSMSLLLNFFSNEIATTLSIQTSIYYSHLFTCKIGVDTAENGPLKVC